MGGGGVRTLMCMFTHWTTKQHLNWNDFPYLFSGRAAIQTEAWSF